MHTYMRAYHVILSSLSLSICAGAWIDERWYGTVYHVCAEASHCTWIVMLKFCVSSHFSPPGRSARPMQWRPRRRTRQIRRNMTICWTWICGASRPPGRRYCSGRELLGTAGSSLCNSQYLVFCFQRFNGEAWLSSRGYHQPSKVLPNWSSISAGVELFHQLHCGLAIIFSSRYPILMKIGPAL